MDTLRKMLWFSLATILVVLWNNWKQDYPTPNQVRPALAKYQSVPVTPKIVPSYTIPDNRQITFQTDVIKGAIDKQGGHLIYLALLKHAESIDTPQQPFVLLDHSQNRYYIAQTELIKPGQLVETATKRLYQSDHTHYVLSPDQDTLRIKLYTQENGVEIIKYFTLKKGQYQIDLNYSVHNNTTSIWKTQLYAQLTQNKGSKSGWLPSTYRGGVLSSDKNAYKKVNFDQIKHKDLPKTKHGWLALTEPYFVNAWISRISNVSYYSHQHQKTYTLGMLSEVWEILPGETRQGALSLYTGPRQATLLQPSAKHLDLLVDYGIFWPIATGLFWLLKQCHDWIDNWGWAIVCLAILLKLCLYKISASQFRSVLAQQSLKPQLDALEKRYAHDQYQLMQAKLALHKRYGTNPTKTLFSGFIQIPISMASYWIFIETIELRHQPFILWIKDLSAPDPYYVLPILMGLTMFLETAIQHILVHSPNEETLPKNITTSLFLPAIFACLFTFIGTNLPVGFVVLLVVQNICSIFQKWWILGAPGIPSIIRSKNYRA